MPDRAKTAAERVAQAREDVRRVVADEVTAATAAIDSQVPPPLNLDGGQEHPAVSTIMRLMHDKSGGPVARVLLGDGRSTEFKSRPLILEQTSDREASDQILYLVINGRGEVFVDEDGKPLVLPEIPLTVQVLDDPSDLVDIKEVASRANVSESTIKRYVASGALKPIPAGKRGKRYRLGDVLDWIARGMPNSAL